MCSSKSSKSISFEFEGVVQISTARKLQKPTRNELVEWPLPSFLKWSLMKCLTRNEERTRPLQSGQCEPPLMAALCVQYPILERQPAAAYVSLYTRRKLWETLQAHPSLLRPIIVAIKTTRIHHWTDLWIKGTEPKEFISTLLPLP